MKSCLILMATYNGEKYLTEQIESIKNQTFINWQLLIRDDGSIDKTKEIISKFVNTDNRIHFVENHTERHGAFINFWQLINIAYKGEEFDYYFFSDQDDIWDSTKIEKMIAFAEMREWQKPLLLYSDMQIIDGHNNIKIESLNRVMGIGKMSGYTEFYSGGYIWGCTVMINSLLLKYIPPLNNDIGSINVMSHDNYYAKLCLLIGKVYFIDEVLIQHREHDFNHTKGYNYKLNPFKILKKFLAINELAKTHANGFKQTLVSFDHFRNNGIDLPIMDEIETAIKNGGRKGLRILKKHKFKRHQISRSIGFKVVVYFKTYKKYLWK